MFRAISALILTTLIAYLYYPVFVDTGNSLPIINMWNEQELPRDFRSTSDELPNTANITGLKELQASGSAQFAENSLDACIHTIPNKNIIIVDLRQESHGFVNGTAMSWYIERDWANKGKTLREVKETENTLLKTFDEKALAILYASRKYPIPFWIKQVYSEETLARSRGLGYLRIPVTDHLKPTDADVDQFVNFITSLPKNSVWLHFHCAAGLGRTTTFMAMLDMMHNASHVSLEDIFERQYQLGGINFAKEHLSEDWKKPYEIERLDFLKNFYIYCQHNPIFQISWTDWAQKNKH